MVLRRLELRCVALKSLSHAARMKLAVTHGLTRDWIKVRIPYAHDQIRHFFHALAGTIDYSIDSLCKRLKFGRLQSQRMKSVLAQYSFTWNLRRDQLTLCLKLDPVKVKVKGQTCDTGLHVVACACKQRVTEGHVRDSTK